MNVAVNSEKRYSAEIEFTLNRLAKTGNCFPVDIPVTIALSSRSKELTQDIIHSRYIKEEFEELNHTETSISCLNFACRFNDNPQKIEATKYLIKCGVCDARPIKLRSELPCGHSFCWECIELHFEEYGETQCPHYPNRCDAEWTEREIVEILQNIKRKLANEENINKCSECGAYKRCNNVYNKNLKKMQYFCEECDESKYAEEDEEDFYDERHEKYGLAVTPFPYQSQSIEWMLERENDPIGLYKYLFAQGHFKNGESFFYSAAMNRLVLADEMPVLRGGFLCEEMGLGLFVCVL